MILKILMSNRAREYGYIFWRKKQDADVERFFREANDVELWFDNSCLGRRRIDWKHRRISVGYVRTRPLSEDISTYHLTRKRDGSVHVICQ